MYAWVIYDIHKNRTRLRVAKRCKFYGLVRVQKSVFLGKMKPKWLRRLYNELSLSINQRRDRLFIVPVSPGSFKRTMQAGAPPLIETTLDDVKTKFFN